MSKSDGAERLALKYFLEQAKILKSLEQRSSTSGFEIAMQRLFGDSPRPGKTCRIGSCELIYCNHTSRLLSIFPSQWKLSLSNSAGQWRGCENWWAGYPFIVLVEVSIGDDGVSGHLKLNAELGPLASRRARNEVIDLIKGAALAKGLARIRFQVSAYEERQLYSRFLRGNSIIVTRVQDAHEVERKLGELISDFRPEFDLITAIGPQLNALKDI